LKIERQSPTLSGVIDRATLRTILISLAIGIFLFYLRPVLEAVPTVVLSVAGGISQRWEDAIFQDAAQPVSAEGLLLVLLVFLGGAVILLLSRTGDDPSQRISRRFMVAILVLVGILVVGVGMIRNTSAAIERCFRTRLAVLSPSITDREAKELVAAWTMMHGRADYEAINQSFRERARTHNIVPLLKSLDGPPRGTCL
jgi:hypothetical protein